MQEPTQEALLRSRMEVLLMLMPAPTLALTVATVVATAVAAWEHEAAAGAVATVQCRRATWVGLTTRRAVGEEWAMFLAAPTALLVVAEEAVMAPVAGV